MGVRVLSALVLAPVVLAAVWIGGWVWALLVAAAAIIATHEGYGIGRAAGMRPTALVGYLVALGLTLLALPQAQAGLGVLDGRTTVMAVLALGVMLAFGDQVRREPEERAIQDWALTLALPVYLGALASFAAGLRILEGGLAWTTLLFLLVWTNDSAAYFGGRALGRHKMAPSISPKKTWEGFASGMLGALILAALAPAIAGWVGATFPSLAAEMAPLAEAPIWALLAMALLVSCVGPLGDLSVSVLKRLAGVKDSGNLIPGHGGILDRTDALLFAAPVVYLTALLLTAS